MSPLTYGRVRHAASCSPRTPTARCRATGCSRTTSHRSRDPFDRAIDLEGHPAAPQDRAACPTSRRSIRTVRGGRLYVRSARRIRLGRPLRSDAGSVGHGSVVRARPLITVIFSVAGSRSCRAYRENNSGNKGLKSQKVSNLHGVDTRCPQYVPRGARPALHPLPFTTFVSVAELGGNSTSTARSVIPPCRPAQQPLFAING